MGFDRKMINKVYILLKPANIERAIDYMTEIDDIFQHDFIPGSNQSLCFICKKPRKNHLDYIPDDLLVDEQANNNLVNNIQFIDDIHDNNNKEEKKLNIKLDDNDLNDECEVCYEELNKDKKEFNSIPCGHLFCTHCWFNYLKTSILEAKVDKIKHGT